MELVFPGGTYGIRKRLVPAELIPVAEAQVAGQARHPPHRGRLASLAWRLLARPV